MSQGIRHYARKATSGKRDNLVSVIQAMRDYRSKVNSWKAESASFHDKS